MCVCYRLDPKQNWHIIYLCCWFSRIILKARILVTSLQKGVNHEKIKCLLGDTVDGKNPAPLRVPENSVLSQF